MPVHKNQCTRPISASARYRPLLTCILKSRSFGQTRKQTRVVASKSTLDLPITLKATRIKRNQGNTETVSHEYWFVESQGSNPSLICGSHSTAENPPRINMVETISRK